MGKNSAKTYVVIFITLATAVFFVISPSISTADVAVTGTVMVQGHLLTPPITVITTPNVTYKATTFEWSVENGTMKSRIFCLSQGMVYNLHCSPVPEYSRNNVL